MSDTLIYLNDLVSKDGSILGNIPLATLLKVEICYTGRLKDLENYLSISINTDKMFDNTYCPIISNYITKYNKNSIVYIVESKTNNDCESYKPHLIRHIAFVFSIRDLKKGDIINVDSFNCSVLEVGKKIFQKNLDLIKDIEIDYCLTRDSEATMLSFSIDSRNKREIETALIKKIRILKNDEIRLFRLCLMGIVDESIVKNYAKETLNNNLIQFFSDIEYELPPSAKSTKRKRKFSTDDFIQSINSCDYDNIMLCLVNRIELQPGYEIKFVNTIEDLSYVDYDIDTHLIHTVLEWCLNTMNKTVIDLLEERKMLPEDLMEEEKLNLDMVKALI